MVVDILVIFQKTRDPWISKMLGRCFSLRMHCSPIGHSCSAMPCRRYIFHILKVFSKYHRRFCFTTLFPSDFQCLIVSLCFPILLPSLPALIYRENHCISCYSQCFIRFPMLSDPFPSPPTLINLVFPLCFLVILQGVHKFPKLSGPSIHRSHSFRRLSRAYLKRL